MQPVNKYHTPKKTFNHIQLDAAVEVLMYSRIVRKWVIAEAKFLGIEPTSPEWDQFYARNAKKAALRLIKQ